MQKKEKKQPDEQGEKFNDFIQAHRKGIFISLAVIIVLFFGVIVFLALQTSVNKKAIAQVEELTVKYDEIRYNVNDENYAEQVEEVLAGLNDFAKKNRGYAGSRAWSMIANIYSAREDWANCEEAWLNSAKTGNKTYLAPIAYFNASAAAEEQKKYEQAIEYLQKALSHTFEFPQAARAQFNIGRLYEETGDYSLAMEAYREVLVKWDEIPVWQHFARSRILAIEIQ